MRITYLYLILLTALLHKTSIAKQPNHFKTDVLIVGGGASGVTAAIQAARMGVKVLIVEETNWLGGMLTSAGVSAIDGNHQLPSGLWGEFRDSLRAHYGGAAALETGWVSNTLFEPSVGNRILKNMVAKQSNITVLYQTSLASIKKEEKGWAAKVSGSKSMSNIIAKILIDATELGDVFSKVGVKYKIGMDSKHVTNEEFAPEKENDIIQDLTYVAILKDYGPNNKIIAKPKGYDPKVFAHACDVQDPASHDNTPIIDCTKMITYGKLPNGKYMINWPKDGNDIYLNIIEKSPKEREELLKEAKLHTLRFVYHIQTALGYKNLGLAKDEYNTKDLLPFIPYHRESRRIESLSNLTLPYISDPYNQKNALYRTGVIVGDYTIDHHHLKNPNAPDIDFVKIKVPSYNVPLGSLIPVGVDDIIVAEKSIGVSNIVAGATRLQPVVLGIGQASGALAALAVKKSLSPKDVSIREVQQELIKSSAYLMPFIDVKPTDKNFGAIQRIGATGILKGRGMAYKWANQTWFYPHHAISEYDLVNGLKTYYPQLAEFPGSGKDMDAGFFVEVLQMINKNIVKEKIFKELGKDASTLMNREEVAVAVDKYLNPFAYEIDVNGNLVNK